MGRRGDRGMGRWGMGGWGHGDMGTWGDGEMGRGDGEMGRWGDGEVGRWGDDQGYLVVVFLCSSLICLPLLFVHASPQPRPPVARPSQCVLLSGHGCPPPRCVGVRALRRPHSSVSDSDES